MRNIFLYLVKPIVEGVILMVFKEIVKQYKLKEIERNIKVCENSSDKKNDCKSLHRI